VVVVVEDLTKPVEPDLALPPVVVVVELDLTVVPVDLEPEAPDPER